MKLYIMNGTRDRSANLKTKQTDVDDVFVTVNLC